MVAVGLTPSRRKPATVLNLHPESSDAMDQHCSYCGVSVPDGASCPVCGTRLVAVNLRRTLLWALVAEEYLVLVAVMIRLAG